MLKNLKKHSKKVLKNLQINTKTNLAIIFCFLLYTPFAFADLGQLKDKVNSEIKSTGASILQILNTVVATMGVIYVIIIGFMFLFKHEAFKENSKALITGLVAVGALYGITNMGLSALSPN